MADFKTVASRRIYFGHQSVGGNLMAGVIAEAGGTLRVKQVDVVTGGELAEPGFVHGFVGRNEAPLTKLADFEKNVDALGQVDLALMKFCYVDFSATTDVPALFAQYRATLQRLREKHPNTHFIHVTTPLTVVQGGAKGFLKDLVGSGAWGRRENVKRHAYNELLRAEYGADVFDLAALEATQPDGAVLTYDEKGARVPQLVPGYSDDGGHLNANAQRRLGSAMIRFLAGRL